MDASPQSRSPPSNRRSPGRIVIHVLLIGLRPARPSPCYRTLSCSPIVWKPRRTNCSALVVCRAATSTRLLATSVPSPTMPASSSNAQQPLISSHPPATQPLLPTPAYDQWLGQDAPSRWRLVTKAWLAEDRFFARSADAGGHTLGQEAYARGAAGLRKTVVGILADAKPGTTLDLGTAGHGCFLAPTQADPGARNGQAAGGVDMA